MDFPNCKAGGSLCEVECFSDESGNDWVNCLSNLKDKVCIWEFSNFVFAISYVLQSWFYPLCLWYWEKEKNIMIKIDIEKERERERYGER